MQKLALGWLKSIVCEVNCTSKLVKARPNVSLVAGRGATSPYAPRAAHSPGGVPGHTLRQTRSKRSHAPGPTWGRAFRANPLSRAVVPGASGQAGAWPERVWDRWMVSVTAVPAKRRVSRGSGMVGPPHILKACFRKSQSAAAQGSKLCPWRVPPTPSSFSCARYRESRPCAVRLPSWGFRGLVTGESGKIGGWDARSRHGASAEEAPSYVMLRGV